MKLLAVAVAIATSLLASAALADPVVWTLNGVTTLDGQTITGSFTYDADTDTYTAIDISSTGGVGPFTELFPGRPSDVAFAIFNQSPAGDGQNAIAFVTDNKTNAGGPLTIRTGQENGGLFTCTGMCTGGNFTAGRSIATGTIVGEPVVPVPTLSEWAMILFGTVLAGGAALYVQRRRLIA